MADFINVTTLNRLAKDVLAQCEPLNDLIVCGEIHQALQKRSYVFRFKRRKRKRKECNVSQSNAIAEL